MRITATDRLHVGNRVTATVGPVELPDLDTARRRLAAFAAHGPHTRIALRLDDGRRWVHDPEAMLASVTSVDRSVSSTELLTSTGAHGSPLQVTLAGDRLRTEHDHGAGEVQLAVLVHQIVTGAVDPDDPELHRRIGARARVPALPAAIGRVFLRHPGHIRDLFRSIHDADDLPTPPVSPGPAPTVLTRHTEVAEMSAATATELRRWRRERGARASVVTLTTCGVARALAANGIEAAPEVTLPVDLRRYLSGSVNPLGNFVAGLALAHDPVGDHEALQRRIDNAIACGRPIAALVRGILRNELAGGRAAAAAKEVDRRASLLFSGIPELPQFATLPWTDRSTSHYLACVDPAGPTGITLISVNLHGRLLLSASFHPEIHPAPAVAAAIGAFADDPVGLLTRPCTTLG